MLRELRLRNFKAYGEIERVAHLSDITLIYGPNSGGKSSIVQALLLLKQSLDSSKQGFRRELMIRGDVDRGDVDLGSFSALIHRHETHRELVIGIGYDVGSRGTFTADIDLVFANAHSSQNNSPTILSRIEYRLFERGEELFSNSLEYSSQDDCWKSASDFHIVRVNNEVRREERERAFFPKWEPQLDATSALLKNLEQIISDILSDEWRDSRHYAELQRKANRRGRSTLSELAELTVVKEELDRHYDSAKVARACVTEVQLALSRLELSGLMSSGPESNPSIRSWNIIRSNVEELLKVCAIGVALNSRIRKGAWSGIEQQAKILQTNLVDKLFANVTKVDQIQETYESLLNSLIHLGPIRNYPERQYPVAGSPRASTGFRGEHTAHLIYRSDEIKDKVNYWFGADKFDIPYELQAKALDNSAQVGQNIYLELIDTYTRTPVTIADVGFGISCVLPVIVEGIASPPGSIICVEQPEIHLHPRLQGHLADLMVETAKEGKQWIVETHSEMLARRIQTRISEKETLKPSDVSVLYVSPNEYGSRVERQRIRPDGLFFKEWPQGFFMDGYQESIKLWAAQDEEEEV